MGCGAQPLSAPDDEAGGDGLPLLQGDPRHGGSLGGDPDVVLVHLRVGIAGSRQDQRGGSGSVCPI